MTLLTPLGLLGLLSIAVLIIIYIIKPNYQQKLVSSTFVWKLSLKYRKKRIPTSKLRNILLIICQVLILVSSTFVLAQPAKVYRQHVSNDEVIVVIDSSASMLTTSADQTRFSRAIDEAIVDISNLLDEGGIVSVIIADDSPEYLFQRATATSKEDITLALEGLKEDNACSYSSADMESAISLTENVLAVNPSAKINLYTDSNYNYVPDGIELINVADDSEWNAAILNGKAEVIENFYEFSVDLAVYAQDREVTITLSLDGVNGLEAAEGQFEFEFSVDCFADEAQRVVFYFDNPSAEDGDSMTREDTETLKYTEYFIPDGGEYTGIYSFSSAFITITAGEEMDSYAMDDNFQIYGGDKEIIDFLYVSDEPNIFFNRLFLADFPSYYGHRWELRWTQVRADGTKEIPNEGYDFYIYETVMPAVMPTDGVVCIVNPQATPSGAGFTFTGTTGFIGVNQYIGCDLNEHPLVKGIDFEDIMVSNYSRLAINDSSYETIFHIAGGDPVVLVKDDGPSKVLVINFPLQYSNFAVTKEFPNFFYNVFDYFYPYTVEDGQNSFEINDTVTFDSRSDSVLVTGPNQFEKEYLQFPSEVVVSSYGTYTFMQTTAYGVEKIDKIFVRLPVKESAINGVEGALKNPYTLDVFEELIDDYLFYIALALLALMFAEWLLHSRENI